MINASSTPTPSGDQLPLEVRLTITRLRARAWGVATGLLFGIVLFAATLILVLLNGPNLGAHLGLLAVFLPGYSVTGFGSFVGLFYGFVIGYALGWLTGKVYNAFVRTN
jgi:hypothetical protein